MARFSFGHLFLNYPKRTKNLIKELGREKGVQTSVATVILLVNLFIVFQAISQLGEKDESGKFRLTAEVIPTDYYALLAVSFAFGFGSMWLIRYQETQSRWGARLLAALLLPFFLPFYTLNLKIFSWEHLQEALVSLF